MKLIYDNKILNMTAMTEVLNLNCWKLLEMRNTWAIHFITTIRAIGKPVTSPEVQDAQPICLTREFGVTTESLYKNRDIN